MIRAYQHGIYPRSEPLVAATRDLDRGRTTAEAVEDLRSRDVARFVETQREAGLDLFSDGMLGWQDLFRPLVVASPGLATGSLVRWFDNNTFYRAPEVRGPVGLDGSLPAAIEALESVPEPRVATLPSPYLLSRVSTGWGRPNDVMRELARGVLRPVAEALTARGVRVIHLQEPWLAYHGIHAEDWGPFEEALAAVTEGLGATTVLHTYFGDAGPHASRLRDLPVDAVGFDFVETDLDALGPGWTKGVLVGCVDGRRSVLESVDGIVELVQRVADRLGVSDLYVSSNCDLEFLPQDLAREKVLRLGEAAARLRESLKEPVG